MKAYVREEQETSKLRRASENIYNIFVKAETNLVFNAPMMQTAVYTCILLVSWFGAKMIASDSLTTGDLIQKEKVFDGFMTLQAKAAKISTSRYKISGTYEWTTRPQGFGTIFKGLRQDIFTIAPDAHGRFSNSTMYAIRKVDWARTVTDAQGVHHMTYGNNNKDFNGANSMTFRDGGGFGIDIPIEYSSTGDGYSYRNYNGYIGGEMLISEDNLRATLKICVDYAKNTKRIGSISSISVSIPPSLSISFSSGGDKYTVQESALMFHVPDFRKVS